MQYVYYCTSCGNMGAMEGEAVEKACPDCGAQLFATHMPKTEWFGLSEQERAAQKEKWKQQKIRATLQQAGDVRRFSGEVLGIPGLAYRIKGARGRTIDIYPYKCVITTGITVGSVLTRNATDGEKTIYYQDCIGLQVKYPGPITIGYLQFETGASMQNNLGSNFFNENTITYEPQQISAAEMAEIVQYVKDQLDAVKEAQRNSWIR